MTLAKISRGTSHQDGKPAQTHRFMAKREAILDAAARQFNKYGLKGATLADVAGSVDLLTNSQNAELLLARELTEIGRAAARSR